MEVPDSTLIVDLFSSDRDGRSECTADSGSSVLVIDTDDSDNSPSLSSQGRVESRREAVDQESGTLLDNPDVSSEDSIVEVGRSEPQLNDEAMVHDVASDSSHDLEGECFDDFTRENGDLSSKAAVSNDDVSCDWSRLPTVGQSEDDVTILEDDGATSRTCPRASCLGDVEPPLVDLTDDIAVVYERLQRSSGAAGNNAIEIVGVYSSVDKEDETTAADVRTDGTIRSAVRSDADSHYDMIEDAELKENKQNPVSAVDQEIKQTRAGKTEGSSSSSESCPEFLELLLEDLLSDDFELNGETDGKELSDTDCGDRLLFKQVFVEKRAEGWEENSDLEGELLQSSECDVSTDDLEDLLLNSDNVSGADSTIKNDSCSGTYPIDDDNIEDNFDDVKNLFNSTFKCDPCLDSSERDGVLDVETPYVDNKKSAVDLEQLLLDDANVVDEIRENSHSSSVSVDEESLGANEGFDEKPSLVFEESFNAFPLSKSLCRFQSLKTPEQSDETQGGSSVTRGKQYLYENSFLSESQYDMKMEAENVAGNDLKVCNAELMKRRFEVGSKQNVVSEDDDYVELVGDVSASDYFSPARPAPLASSTSSGEYLDAQDGKASTSSEEFYDCCDPHDLTLEQENDLLRSDEEDDRVFVFTGNKSTMAGDDVDCVRNKPRWLPGFSVIGSAAPVAVSTDKTEASAGSQCVGSANAVNTLTVPDAVSRMCSCQDAMPGQLCVGCALPMEAQGDRVSESSSPDEELDMLFDCNSTLPCTVDMSICSLDQSNLIETQMDKVSNSKKPCVESNNPAEALSSVNTQNYDLEIDADRSTVTSSHVLKPVKQAFPEAHPDYKSLTLASDATSIPRSLDDVVSSRYVDYVSPDPEENEDNNSAGWEAFRVLQTDEEKFLKVRSRWLNVTMPDPNRDLTLRHDRNKPPLLRRPPVTQPSLDVNHNTISHVNRNLAPPGPACLPHRPPAPSDVSFHTDHFPSDVSGRSEFYTSPVALPQPTGPDMWAPGRPHGIDYRYPVDCIASRPSYQLYPAHLAPNNPVCRYPPLPPSSCLDPRPPGAAVERRGVKRPLEADEGTDRPPLKRARTIPCTKIYDNVLDCAESEQRKKLLALHGERKQAFEQLRCEHDAEAAAVLRLNTNMRQRCFAVQQMQDRQLEDLDLLTTEFDQQEADIVKEFDSKFASVYSAVEELQAFRSFYQNACTSADSYYMNERELAETKEMYDYYTDMRKFYAAGGSPAS